MTSIGTQDLRTVRLVRLGAVMLAMVMAMLLAGPASLGGPSSASAEESVAAAATAPAPGCLSVRDYGSHVSVNNITPGCGRDVRVKVIWAWGSDSACTVVESNVSRVFDKPNSAARFDGVQSC